MVSSLPPMSSDDDPLAFLLEHSGAEDKYCAFQANNLAAESERLNVSLWIYFYFAQRFRRSKRAIANLVCIGRMGVHLERSHRPGNPICDSQGATGSS